MKHFQILVTRHQGLVEFLTQEGYTWDEVVSHVSDPSILDGKDVLGVLPIGLAARCRSISELQLNLPAELRGKELSVDQTRQYAMGIKTYYVSERSLLPVTIKVMVDSEQNNMLQCFVYFEEGGYGYSNFLSRDTIFTFELMGVNVVRVKDKI